MTHKECIKTFETMINVHKALAEFGVEGSKTILEALVYASNYIKDNETIKEITE